MDAKELSRCGRCGKYLRNRRVEIRHRSAPCDQDNVFARRARAAAERADGIPMRPRKGRKLMMRAIQ